MPAIQLARLRLQAAHLGDSFSRPEAFVRGLHAMLDFYADRTLRPGQSGAPHPLISAYHAPAAVLRQILLELNGRIYNDPVQALHLIDVLWKQANLECRVLAASILGALPLDFIGEVLERITTWSKLEKEDQLIDALLDQGLTRYRRESAEMYLRLVERWLASDNLNDQRMALRALRTLLAEVSFKNLPALFRLLTGLTRAVPSGLRNDLVEVMRAMVVHSPHETAYFLRQILASPQSLDTAWLIRKLLPEFPEEAREGLREALRKVGL
jgi:hypothetical protein